MEVTPHKGLVQVKTDDFTKVIDIISSVTQASFLNVDGVYHVTFPKEATDA